MVASSIAFLLSLALHTLYLFPPSIPLEKPSFLQEPPTIIPLLIAFAIILIREQEKLLHLGLITAGNASKKALAAQQQPYQKNPKK